MQDRVRRLTYSSANMIKGKQPEEIRKLFNIHNDFTPEEEAQIRRENVGHLVTDDQGMGRRSLDFYSMYVPQTKCVNSVAPMCDSHRYVLC